jgi:hypothetical protein
MEKKLEKYVHVGINCKLTVNCPAFRREQEKPGESREDPSLAVTEELLSLLEDFKQKSYSLQQMEVLFENWRQKAEVSITPQYCTGIPEGIVCFACTCGWLALNFHALCFSPLASSSVGNGMLYLSIFMASTLRRHARHSLVLCSVPPSDMLCTLGLYSQHSPVICIALP